jgi:ribose transport system substrate-binding protein
MRTFLQSRSSRGRPGMLFLLLIPTLALGAAGCRSSPQPAIAVIPRTEGLNFWEEAHVGAEMAAHRSGASVYWIAPTREDDVEGQIALVERVAARRYQGLVLAPDQALSLISPVRRVLSRGIPTVIIGSALPLTAGGGLCYILNDDEQGGRMAAQRVAALLHGEGSVAVLGITPDVSGVMIRERAFEKALASDAPGIRIVEKKMGLFNVPHEQQVAEESLRAHPDLGAIVALISTSLDGTLSALDSAPRPTTVHVIGFDYGGVPPFDGHAYLDSVIQSNTRLMGEEAIDTIQKMRGGEPVAGLTEVPPVVITSSNLNSAEVRRMLAQDWTLGQWSWSSVR